MGFECTGENVGCNQYSPVDGGVCLRRIGEPCNQPKVSDYTVKEEEVGTTKEE